MGADKLKGNSDDECCDMTGVLAERFGDFKMVVFFQESYNACLEHTPGNPLNQLWKESLYSPLVRFRGVVQRCVETTLEFLWCYHCKVPGIQSPNVRGWWRGVQSPPKRKVFFRSIRRLDAGREASEQGQKLVVIGCIYRGLYYKLSSYMGVVISHYKDPFKTTTIMERKVFVRGWCLGGLFLNGGEVKLYTRRFKVTLWSPSWRSLNLWKGHLTIPKRSQRIAT